MLQVLLTGPSGKGEPAREGEREIENGQVK